MKNKQMCFDWTRDVYKLGFVYFFTASQVNIVRNQLTTILFSVSCILSKTKCIKKVLKTLIILNSAAADAQETFSPVRIGRWGNIGFS